MIPALIRDFFGATGGFCFAYCGVPLAWATIREGKTVKGVYYTALAIMMGGINMYLYLLLTYGFNWLLAINYTIEITSWAIVAYYYLRPRVSS